MPRPRLLLLPGLLCDARLWQAQAEALDSEAEIVVADLTRDDSVDAMAARALDSLPGRFALAGLSMGGYVAFAILRRAAARVTRLCLLDTSARPDTEEQTRRRRGLMALTRSGQARFRGVTPRLLPDLLHPDNLEDTALTGTVIAMAERVGAEAFLRQQKAILGRPDSRPLLPALRLPVLAAAGDADRLTPPHLAEEIATGVPGGVFRLIQGCSHLPPLEHPAEVTEMLRAWLRAGDADGSPGEELGTQF